MSDVLLTYSWVRSSYAAMRNLVRHEVTVCASDSNRIGMCQWSRFKDGFEHYTSHYNDESAFVRRIAAICKERCIRLILPSHNETEILARHRNLLDAELSAALPNADHCALLNNKARAYELASSVSVPVARRIDYFALNEVAASLHESGVKKCVVKLLTGNSSKGVFFPNDPTDAELLVKKLVNDYRLPPERWPQVEERVSGDGWGCSVLYWHSRKIASFTHRRMREKISTGGTSTLRESAVNAALEAAATRIFDRLGWHGLAMCEFKVDPSTGKFWFIEINPRMWGSMPLAISAGAEFPYLVWLCATEGPDVACAYHAQQHIRVPWCSRWLVGDWIAGSNSLLRGRPRSALRSFLPTGADALDDFHIDDPLAFLGEIVHYGAKALTSLSTNPAEKGMVG
jgi:predicted ATP-grasp superfamily ATP-dependent carboligase